MRRYIGDIVKKEDFRLYWRKGSKILITAQTGSGKSYFIQNNFYDYCKEEGYKCLLLSNRDLLKKQNEEIILGKEDVFVLENYQNIEVKIEGGVSIREIFRQFDYVIFDEAQYIFSDSSFNRRTDLLLPALDEEFPYQSFVFLTATPQILKQYKSNYSKIYNSGNDYSYIEEIFLYRKLDSAISVLSNLDYDEKAIYFANKTEDAYDMATIHLKEQDTSFICSQSSDYFGKRRNEETIREIAMYNSFSNKILCTTKVLDNGVNIIDPDVRTIVIESADPINLIQSIGRKRLISPDDKIKLYIRNYHWGDLHMKVDEFEKNLSAAKELFEVGKDEFERRWKKKDIPRIIDNDKTVNYAKKNYFMFLSKEFRKMGKKDGYKQYVAGLFNFDIDNIKILELERKALKTQEIVEEYYSMNKKLFKEEQMEFRKRFFFSSSPNGIGNRKWSLNAMNGIMKDEGIPYFINSVRETAGENKGKRYWKINLGNEGEENE